MQRYVNEKLKWKSVTSFYFFFLSRSQKTNSFSFLRFSFCLSLFYGACPDMIVKQPIMISMKMSRITVYSGSHSVF